MAGTHNFEHLRLVLRDVGEAKLRGGGNPDPQTLANRNAARAHANSLKTSTQSFKDHWIESRAARGRQGLPVIPNGVPILLKVDPELDLDILRKHFSFEIVADQDDGYVIVASEDIELASFTAMVDEFSVAVHGSATIAKIHHLYDDPLQADRLSRVLSEQLHADWNRLPDDQIVTVDVGIACVGVREIPRPPRRRKRDSDAVWAARELEWSQSRMAAYDAWDALKMEREREIENLTGFYQGEILHNVDEAQGGFLPDSFTVRLRIVAKGLKDIVLNYPYVFEVVEPEDIALPQALAGFGAQAADQPAAVEPPQDAPAVCVIDSGIQEGHLYLRPAIDQGTSRCFLPGIPIGQVADEVAPGGHGTRVAGAILYGEQIPSGGAPQLPFWIQNARVLDANNRMPEELFPPVAIRSAVATFNESPRQTRIFNHSINASGYCRLNYMSAWAAEIDQLCNERDVLVVQSAGNLPLSNPAPYLGIAEHLGAGRNYPAFLTEQSARVANPAQSLQALTVGSVAYGRFSRDGWQTFAEQHADPSSFSRSGPGIWGVIKPEVVEFGGDDVRTAVNPPNLQGGGRIREASPSLIRSTLHAPGPAFDRDDVGTSYAAPKVARIAAKIQSTLPNESTLLYRALVVQSARWPEWAEQVLTRLRNPPPKFSQDEKQLLLGKASTILRCIGFGIPDEERATRNSDYRTTLITSGEGELHAKECHIFEVPIPAAIRSPAEEYEIRIDVTLSYVAQPRRTRRHLRRYLSTWLTWTSSKLGEGINDFRGRALKDATNEEAALGGSVLPWALHELPQAGLIRDFKRNNGTVQKDWAIVSSNALPEHFCIAVVGHQGWNQDPDSTARYTLAVTFEILGKEIPIYDSLRVAVDELEAEQPSVSIEVEV